MALCARPGRPAGIQAHSSAGGGWPTTDIPSPRGRAVSLRRASCSASSANTGLLASVGGNRPTVPGPKIDRPGRSVWRVRPSAKAFLLRRDLDDAWGVLWNPTMGEVVAVPLTKPSAASPATLEGSSLRRLLRQDAALRRIGRRSRISVQNPARGI
jgi:hypothetical protein